MPFCHLLEYRKQSFQLHRLVIHENYGPFPDDEALVEVCAQRCSREDSEIVIEALNEKLLGEILGVFDCLVEASDQSDHGGSFSL